MALRVLLFTKDVDTATAMASLLAESGIDVEKCSDIFSAVDKGTKQSFAAVIVDWAEQPEAGFLLRRARESQVNRATVPLAIVNDEPPPEQLRDHRLEYLFYRPIVADEARSVLAKARQKMEVHFSALVTETQVARSSASTGSADSPDPNFVAAAEKLPGGVPERLKERHQVVAEETVAEEQPFDAEEPAAEEPEAEVTGRKHINFRAVAAAVLALAAGYFLWQSRAAFAYLRTTPEGTMHVLRDSVATLFYANGSGAQPLGSVVTEAQQDAYFNRSAAPVKDAQSATVGVVDGEVSIPDVARPLPKPLDLPLPAPQLVRVDPGPIRPQSGPIPESIRSSAPIASPVVVTVNPAQMMPVSTPIPSTPIQSFSEPVPITEASARAMATHTVAPVYPPEAQAQKLQGTVVLQAVIGRDGSVQDLKIVAGYFLLGKAAIAAVKQWKFQPYSVNGHPASTQTNITVKFSPPA